MMAIDLNAYIPVWMALITFGTLVVNTVFAYLANRQGNLNATKLDEHTEALKSTQDNVSRLETNTNSKMDQLLATNSQASYSAGVIQGTKTEQDRVK